MEIVCNMHPDAKVELISLQGKGFLFTCEECEDNEKLLDLQHSRMVQADKLWQKETGNLNVLPDLGKLIEWLLEKRSVNIRGYIFSLNKTEDGLLQLTGKYTETGEERWILKLDTKGEILISPFFIFKVKGGYKR